VSRAIETVAVVGRDATAWIAASALHRAVGKAGVKVRVVELPSLLSPVDAYAALPAIRGLHQLLGLDEAMVLAAADGVPRVAQRFSNWSGAAPPFVHGYDDAPPPGGDLDFVHYWAKGRL
jgi:tryptophan halogenase